MVVRGDVAVESVLKLDERVDPVVVVVASVFEVFSVSFTFVDDDVKPVDCSVTLTSVVDCEVELDGGSVVMGIDEAVVLSVSKLIVEIEVALLEV